jgi:hypothetical protein
LSDLLMIIGHCEKELTIGTMDRIKDRMPPRVLADASFNTYFQAVGQPWQGELDRTLDRYIALASNESRYWEVYQTRVNQAIGNTLVAEFVYRKRGDPALINDFAKNVVGYAEAQWAHLEASGTLIPLVFTTPSEPTSQRKNRFQRNGSAWTIEFDGKAIGPRDSKGLRYLAYLLQHPHREFSGVELAQVIEGTAVVSPNVIGASVANLSDEGLLAGLGTGDAGPVLDDAAKKDYERRLAEIDEDIADAHVLGDDEGVEELKNEREALLTQLVSAVGLGGRDRVVSSDIERARLLVTNPIRRAKYQIAEVHPGLAAHLNYVKSGYFFSYDPPRDNIPLWEF